MRILLAGGTGVVGTALLRQGRARGDHLIAVGRRPTGLADEELVTNFNALPQLPSADVAICALGTTIHNAGSREAFRAVDHGAVLAFAKAALEARIKHFLVVTAVGADPASGVFYSRVKGEIQQDLCDLGFSRLDVLQPGLLRGERQEKRPVESMMKTLAPIADRLMTGSWRRYRSIHPAAVAECLLTLTSATEAGVFIHQYDAMQNCLNHPK
ncbi:MAG: sugar nucleotide-binding protein [Proteobacteria bacterium]|nr:sugar nucleotide-binding protein [Pseudomonadota bacterium]